LANQIEDVGQALATEDHSVGQAGFPDRLYAAERAHQTSNGM
jgi:hypothetical protein